MSISSPIHHDVQVLVPKQIEFINNYQLPWFLSSNRGYTLNLAEYPTHPISMHVAGHANNQGFANPNTQTTEETEDAKKYTSNSHSILESPSKKIKSESSASMAFSPPRRVPVVTWKQQQLQQNNSSLQRDMQVAAEVQAFNKQFIEVFEGKVVRCLHIYMSQMTFDCLFVHLLIHKYTYIVRIFMYTYMQAHPMLAHTCVFTSIASTISQVFNKPTRLRVMFTERRATRRWLQ
jgi:hypothetical protein